jgi:hypothetical protein
MAVLEGALRDFCFGPDEGLCGLVAAFDEGIDVLRPEFNPAREEVNASNDE